MDLTLGAALLAGLLSFLSPCVLPVVPAYLGQLGIIAVQSPLAAPAAGAAGGRRAAGPLPLGRVSHRRSPAPSRRPAITPLTGALPAGWRAMPNAFAFVLGFSVVFTVLGVAAYFVAGPLRDNLPLLRQVGGIILVILGLNLMGVLRLRTLARSWKPLERFGGEQPGARRGGVVGGFALGSVFALGWTPCIGPTLGAILTMAAVGTSPQVVSLLAGLLDRPGHPLHPHGPGRRPGAAHHAAAAALQPPDRDRRRRAHRLPGPGPHLRLAGHVRAHLQLPLAERVTGPTTPSRRPRRDRAGVHGVALVSAGHRALHLAPPRRGWPPSWRQPPSSWSLLGTPLGAPARTAGPGARLRLLPDRRADRRASRSASSRPSWRATVDGEIVGLRDLDGQPLRLADLRGEPVWLSFFATWCPPCQEETPVLREAYERYGPRGLQMVAVSVQETTPDDVAAWAETYDLRYPIGFDATSAVFHTYEGFGLPTHVFIDRDGVIRHLQLRAARPSSRWPPS